jgi:hypothetical protein
MSTSGNQRDRRGRAQSSAAAVVCAQRWLLLLLGLQVLLAAVGCCTVCQK